MTRNKKSSLMLAGLTLAGCQSQVQTPQPGLLALHYLSPFGKVIIFQTSGLLCPVMYYTIPGKKIKTKEKEDAPKECFVFPDSLPDYAILSPRVCPLLLPKSYSFFIALPIVFANILPK